MNNGRFDELLLSAEKPSRYIGAEVNAARKDKAEIRFLRGRLHFEDEDGNRFPPAPFPSMVVVYNGDYQCLN